MLNSSLGIIIKKIGLCLVLFFTILSVKGETMRTIPTPLYGVTIDSIEPINKIIKSLKGLPKTPTVRIVFDENVPASEYKEAVDKLHGVSYIMGELLDSDAFEIYDLKGYKQRTMEYLKTLDGKVDIWEVGNEVNGEWLGQDQAEVIQKVAVANELVKAAGGRTALTLYYNIGCSPKPENEMFIWANAMPLTLRLNFDYVFISYYPDDCPGPTPQWDGVFAKLHLLFPNSKLGFGETGTEIDGHKDKFIKKYYTLKVNSPFFVGGYFWWYFIQDMVPDSKPLLSVLSYAMENMRSLFEDVV
jgi:hypothetical protein